VRQDITYFLLMVQYLVPGLVLAWAYDHTGTLWSSILLHAAANALSCVGRYVIPYIESSVEFCEFF